MLPRFYQVLTVSEVPTEIITWSKDGLSDHSLTNKRQNKLIKFINYNDQI